MNTQAKLESNNKEPIVAAIACHIASATETRTSPEEWFQRSLSACFDDLEALIPSCCFACRDGADRTSR